METVCSLNQCTGCMLCVDICPRQAIHIEDSLDSYNALIDRKKCINCNACHNMCQNNCLVTKKPPIMSVQGWIGEDPKRERGSSGGVGSSLIEVFSNNTGSVYACYFSDGEFKFKKFSDKENIEKFSGSKYVKSNPIGIYLKIKKELLEGRKVLFIGLPCQVAAVKIFCKGLDNNLYTVDLICHGTPSPQILDSFFRDFGMTLKDVNLLRFRKKDNYHIYSNKEFNSKIPENVMDMYTYAFLNGITFTDNCYQCQYATINRVSDMTIGDSWGSLLPKEERNKGISLILCQTEKGKELLSMLNMIIYDVNLEKAVAANHQLMSPSNYPKERKCFFKYVKRGMSFDKAMRRSAPKAYYKKKLKKLLIQCKLLS
ncbi:MAG: Coenzyme F420 hydrogenase/dehydrogenase, beta subunit C-terminal domain [Lachnospiraceae bacterium]|nr:Coenzyme F420 hydrogenase/dehydrogenase, beta subunit C-terminal domain [Lachnospiraceae bacterium]